MVLRTTAILGALCWGAVVAWAGEFVLRDDGASLTVLEGNKPILAYLYSLVDPPGDLDKERWRRSSYIHPLYGLDGDVLTQDFPPDHIHQRGVFWAWPSCSAGDKPMDTWGVNGIRQLFKKWLTREAGPSKAVVGIENAWVFDDDPAPVVRERVQFTVHPADDDGRAIDFHLTFTNTSSGIVTFLGQTDENKGYGGFGYRPDVGRPDRKMITALGVLEKEAVHIETPWADYSSRIRPNEAYSGVAIFQHPANPGYPHPGWLLRFRSPEYAFLGASWPHREPVVLQPGESSELRYRLYVHRGTGDEARVAQRFQAYVQQSRNQKP